MPWKQRRGKRYYYQNQRVGRRVISVYVGTGLIAECAALLDGVTIRRRALARLSREDDRALGDLDRALADLARQIRDVTAAELEARGFHQHHRGEWRKRRDKKERTDPRAGHRGNACDPGAR